MMKISDEDVIKAFKKHTEKNIPVSVLAGEFGVAINTLNYRFRKLGLRDSLKGKEDIPEVKKKKSKKVEVKKDPEPIKEKKQDPVEESLDLEVIHDYKDAIIYQRIDDHSEDFSLSYKCEIPTHFYFQPRKYDMFMAELFYTSKHVQAGRRPVVVIQNDVGNIANTTVIVIPCTSKKKTDLPTHVVIPSGICTLTSDTTVLTEQIMTLSKSDLREYLGTLVNTPYEFEIERSVQVSIGGGNVIMQKSVNKEAVIKRAETTVKKPVPVAIASKHVHAETQQNTYKGMYYSMCSKCGLITRSFHANPVEKLQCKYCNAEIDNSVLTRFNEHCECGGTRYGYVNMKNRNFISSCGYNGCNKTIELKYDEKSNQYIGKNR